MYRVRAPPRVDILVTALIGGTMIAIGSGVNEMAKKPMGRPPSGRNDVNVKFDRTLASRAKVIAQGRGITLAEYLSETARTGIDRDYARLMRELEGGPKS
jgi:hypothetical protein